MFKNLFKDRARSGHELALRGSSVPIGLVRADRALGEWKVRRAKFDQTGLWPVLLGPQHELEHLTSIEDMVEEFERTPEDVIAGSEGVNVDRLLKERLDQWTSDAEEDGTALDADFDALGLEAEAAHVPLIVTAFGAIEPKAKSAGLAEVPCAAPWQLLANRPFGGWNEVPTDAELTAVLRSWHSAYSAVPLGVAWGTLELWLDRPITDPNTAKSLAVEMYALCPDIVEQGVESIENLAQSLVGSHVWFFWWD
jgi:hypothetical protein